MQPKISSTNRPDNNWRVLTAEILQIDEICKSLMAITIGHMAFPDTRLQIKSMEKTE
jgi:hypothetical protein